MAIPLDANTTDQQQPKKRFSIRTIRARLLIGFVLMALLSAIGIAAGSVVVGYVNGLEQTRNRLDSVALSKELQISAWTDGLQNELAAVLTEEYAAERATIVLALARDHKYYSYYNGAMRERLSLFVAQSPEIEELFLLDLNGQVVLSTSEMREGEEASAQPYFQKGLSEPYIQLPFQRLIFIARPVLTPAGQSLGVLVGRVGTDSLRQVLAEQTGLGETGKAYLVDQTHTLLTASNPALEPPGHLTGRSDGIEAILKSKTYGSGAYADYSGTLVMGVSRWLPELKTALLVEQDQTEVFQAVFTSLGINLLITLLVVLLALVVSSYISKSIATPLVNLADTATQIAAGDLTRQTEVKREDEVGVVARAFNSMTYQLRDLISSLEQRVAERTQALQSANRSLERQTVQLETSAQVSREITSILEIDQLLNRVVSLIGNAFNYDYVHIYLLNQEENQLQHRAGNMEDGPQLRILPVTGEGLNSEVVRENRAVQVNDVAEDGRYLIDENMPDTQSELVLPLRVGDRVIGTLDVQSRQVAAFTEADGLVLQSLGDQIAIAIENARLYRRSQELAVMEERTRLARDLHDSVTQSLYSLNLMVAGWQQSPQADKAGKVDAYLQRTAQITQRMLREMRLMIHEMRPPDLEEEELVGALHKRLEAVENRAGVRTHLVTEDLQGIATDIEEELYLIALEALNNSLKHAAATAVTITIHTADDQILLEVKDNGRGFELEMAEHSGGLGLTIMKERADQLDGDLSISTEPGAGTAVTAKIPLA